MAKPSIEEVTRSFEIARPRYEDFATRLHQLTLDLLRQQGLSTINVESRVKAVESFSEKIVRKDYNNPLKQMTDLIGLRIVTYYLEDVEKIGDLISREFDVHEEDSVKKASELGIDQFGYRSDHYVVSINEPRKALIEWTEYAELKAEIQVRTALQHAWAAVDHKLNYKKIDEVPKELRRRLVRLSALFELADEEFSTIRRQRSTLMTKASQDVAAGNLSAKLDDISFSAYLNSIHSSLKIDGSKLAHLESSSRNLRSPLDVLRRLEIRTIEDLQQTIDDDWAKNNRELAIINEALNKYGGPSIRNIDFAIVVLAMTRRNSTIKAIDTKHPTWVAARDAAKKLGYQ